MQGVTTSLSGDALTVVLNNRHAIAGFLLTSSTQHSLVWIHDVIDHDLELDVRKKVFRGILWLARYCCISFGKCLKNVLNSKGEIIEAE